MIVGEAVDDFYRRVSGGEEIIQVSGWFSKVVANKAADFYREREGEPGELDAATVPARPENRPRSQTDFAIAIVGRLRRQRSRSRPAPARRPYSAAFER